MRRRRWEWSAPVALMATATLSAADWRNSSARIETASATGRRWPEPGLQQHDVSIVMAGDTHDFEYYAEERTTAGAEPVHHFVNGGGGAYLSFGTALAWPETPAARRWAFYPRTEDVRAKIGANLTLPKRPLWWWTNSLAAWPFSVEWLSAAFDFNVAPFFQSFVEVRVEPSARRVRVMPYGVSGRLRWDDLQGSADLLPPGAQRGDFAEWTVAMP